MFHLRFFISPRQLGKTQAATVVLDSFFFFPDMRCVQLLDEAAHYKRQTVDFLGAPDDNTILVGGLYVRRNKARQPPWQHPGRRQHTEHPEPGRVR